MRQIVRILTIWLIFAALESSRCQAQFVIDAYPQDRKQMVIASAVTGDDDAGSLSFPVVVAPDLVRPLQEPSSRSRSGIEVAAHPLFIPIVVSVRGVPPCTTPPTVTTTSSAPTTSYTTAPPQNTGPFTITSSNTQTTCTAKNKGQQTCTTTWTETKTQPIKICTTSTTSVQVTTKTTDCHDNVISNTTTTYTVGTPSVTCVNSSIVTTSPGSSSVILYFPDPAPDEPLPPPTLPPNAYLPPQPPNDTPAQAAGDIYMLAHTPALGQAWVYKFDRQASAPPNYQFPSGLLFSGNPADLFGISADRINFVYTLHLSYSDTAPRNVITQFGLLNNGTWGNKVWQMDPSGNESAITVVAGQTQAQPGYVYLPPPANIVHPNFQATNGELYKLYPASYPFAVGTEVWPGFVMYPSNSSGWWHGGIMSQGIPAAYSAMTNVAALNVVRGLVKPPSGYASVNFTMDTLADDGVLKPTAGKSYPVSIVPRVLVPILNTDASTVNNPPFYLSADTADLVGSQPDVLPHPTMVDKTAAIDSPGALFYSRHTSRHWVSHFCAKRYTGGLTVQKTTYGAQRYGQGASNQMQSPIGPGVAVSCDTKYKYFQRSSCGEGCLNGPASLSGGTSAKPPSRLFFSSLGGNSACPTSLNGVAFQISNNAIVSKSLNCTGTTWITNPPDTGNWFPISPPGWPTTPQYTSLGVADKTTTSAWVYYTAGVPQNAFAVASTFWHDGGIVYSYDPKTNQIDWGQYIGGSKKVSGNITLPTLTQGSQLEAITADGLGNVGVLRATFDPPGVPPNFAGNHNTAAPPDFDTISIPIDVQTPDKAPLNKYVAAVGNVYQYTVDAVPHRNVILNQYLTYDLSHIPLNTLQGGTTVWANAKPVSRGTIAMPPVRWVRSQTYSTITSTWTWEGEPVYDARNSIPDYAGSYRIELCSVDITEPPTTSGSTSLSILSQGWTGGPGTSPSTPELITEDVTKTFDIEHGPVWNWLLAGPLGAQNSSFNLEDKDNNGAFGSFVSSIVNPWTGVVSGISSAAGETTSCTWRWTITNMTTNGQGNSTPFSFDGNAKTHGNQSTGTLNSAISYRFKDPGNYRVDLTVSFLQWQVPQGLTIDSTIDNLTFKRQTLSTSHYIRVKTTQGQDNYVQNITIDGPAKGIIENAPEAASVPVPPGTFVVGGGAGGPDNNWFSSADIFFYRGIDYDYYKGQGSAADLGADVAKMGKYNGLGKWDYQHPDRTSTYGACPTTPPVGVHLPVNYCAPAGGLNDGVPRVPGTPSTAEGTMSAESRYSKQNMIDSNEAEYDWYEIKYYWFLRYRDPNTGAYVLTTAIHPAAPTNDGKGGGTYHRIREGNLAEVWALERARKAGVFPHVPNLLPKNYKIASPFKAWETTPQLIDVPNPALPATDPSSRHYQVHIPLIRPTLLQTTNPFGDANAPLISAARTATTTFPTAAVSRMSFKIPTDPSALELVCRIQYPKVKWVPLIDPLNGTGTYGTQYYTLVDDGTNFGTYKTSGVSTPSMGQSLGDGQVDNDDGDFIDFAVLDDTRPQIIPGAITGKFGTGDFLTGSFCSVTVRDNNPYQHWKNTRLPSAVPMTFTDSQLALPTLDYFAYEAGIDPRDLQNGLTFTGSCLGFDLGTNVNTFPSLANPADDFDSGPGRLSPTWYQKSKSEDANSPVLTPYTSLTRSAGGRNVQNAFILDFPDSGNVTDPNHVNFNKSASFSTVVTASTSLSDTKVLQWISPPDGSLRRETVWNFPTAQYSLPLFSLGGATGDNRLLAFVRGSDYRNYNTSTNPSLDENLKPAATYAGAISLEDNKPPHLRITLTDSRTGTPRVYAIYPEHTRTVGTMPANYPVRIHISNDGSRPVYSSLGITRGGYDNHGGGSGQFSATTPNAINVDLTQPIPTGKSPDWPLATVGAYYIEESTALSVLVECMDNIDNEKVGLSLWSTAGTSSLAATTGLPNPAPTGSPLCSPACTNAVAIAPMRKAILRVEARYPTAGTYDIIQVQAKDAIGNVTSVKLPIIVVSSNATMRKAGEMRR